MARLPPSLLYRAHKVSPHLRTLLPACRDLDSARNELRWIKEHVACSPKPRTLRTLGSPASASAASGASYHEYEISRLVSRRGRGEPLQYVLRSQPFGRLQLRCGRDVLIPRLETEAYVVHLASLIRQGQFPTLNKRSGELQVMDLCTGTGCIALLLYEQLVRDFPKVGVTAWDISQAAIRMASANLKNNVDAGLLPEQGCEESRVTFQLVDIFNDAQVEAFGCQVHRPGGADRAVDVLVSNPPYISTRGFNQDTGRSVRKFEPKLALVPDDRLKTTAALLGCRLEDVFYARMFELARTLKPSVMLFEVGDMQQAIRVVRMATGIGSPDDFAYEIWRDEPDVGDPETTTLGPENSELIIRGEGHGRSVLIYRKTNDNLPSATHERVPR